MEQIIVAIGDVVFKRETNEMLRYAGFAYVFILIVVALFTIKRPIHDESAIASSGKISANFLIGLVVLLLIVLFIMGQLKWGR